MESKFVKVIDEHGIDRNAHIIFSIDVDGSDYAIYWIERDSENDNIFVSKLIKNIDNTSNMINIEDSMEKSKISDLVKELIKYSIDNENDKLSVNSVMLPSGKNVSFSSVIINKEQNINVQKTYITTVKKTVVKVTSEYFDVEVKTQNVSENVPEIFPITSQSNVLEKEEETSVIEPVVSEQKVDVAPAPVLPIVEPVISEQKVDSVEPVVEQIAPVSPVPAPVLSEPVVEPSIVPNIVAPVEPTSVISNIAESSVIPVVSEPVVEKPVEPVVVTNVVTPVVSESVKSPEPVVIPEPVVVQENPNEGLLVFDASKESNLNVALGEASSESKIPVEDVNSIREFGQDVPKEDDNAPRIVNNFEVISKETNLKAGFANNKFFMIIAIAFFLASCVFLGYEVFRYFQVK